MTTFKVGEFKVGERVVKARPYNSEKYCCYSGNNTEVPIGTVGTIKDINRSDSVSVLFDNGVDWNVHPDELDHWKFNPDEEFKRCLDKLEAKKKLEELKKKEEEKRLKRMKLLKRYSIGETVVLKKEIRYDNSTFRRNAKGIITSISTTEPRVKIYITDNTESRTDVSIYADVEGIIKSKVEIPIKINKMLFLPLSVKAFELEKLSIEEQIKKIKEITQIDKVVKEQDHYLITTKNLKATYSGKIYDIGAYELKLYPYDELWLVKGRNLNGGYDLKDDENYYEEDGKKKYYKCHNPFIEKAHPDSNYGYNHICFGSANSLRGKFSKEKRIFELIHLTLSNLTSSSNAGYTNIIRWVKMLK